MFFFLSLMSMMASGNVFFHLILFLSWHPNALSSGRVSREKKTRAAKTRPPSTLSFGWPNSHERLGNKER